MYDRRKTLIVRAQTVSQTTEKGPFSMSKQTLMGALFILVMKPFYTYVNTTKHITMVTEGNTDVYR